MKRPLLLPALLTIALAGLGCAKTEAPVTVDIGPDPYVLEVSGNVILKRGTSIFHPDVMTVLEVGDLVQTGPTGTADIVWPEYGHTMLAGSSSLRIEEARTIPVAIGLGLEAGRVWTRLQKLLGGEAFFGIHVSNVSAVVRGTSFGVRLDGTEAVVQVTESTVGVLRDDGTYEKKVLADQEVRVAVGEGTDGLPIPAPQPIDPGVSSDPFVQRASRELTDAELHATNTHAADLSGPVAYLLVIESGGRLLPLNQIHSYQAEAGCSEEHYHANNGVVIALDGTIVYDPGNCGFGRVRETPTIQLEVR